MLKQNNDANPKLQPPGKGLPKMELLVARLLVGIKLRTTSQEKALDVFVREEKKIMSLLTNVDSSLASKRVLIKRLPGLEDSSRYWSLYMTMEHLRIVNRSMIDVIKSLSQGVKPQVVVSIAAVKPREDIDETVVSQFESVCKEFETSFPMATNFASDVTLAHPWFGELNARQWHFFAGFHMSLHRKQMTTIAANLR